MAFKFCPECGYKFDREYKFCPECGYSLTNGGAKKSEPLFDFSADTAQYGDMSFDGFDKQLEARRTVEEPKVQKKTFQVIYNEKKLRELEQSTFDDLDTALWKCSHGNKNTKNRHCEDLADQFAQYFAAYKEFDDNGITFERDVPPTYFGAKPYCKPIHFLFKRNGRDVLALAILTENNYKHPAITTVRDGCLRKKIKYVYVKEEYANTEHYVVRLVLEMLDIIPPVHKRYRLR